MGIASAKDAPAVAVEVVPLLHFGVHGEAFTEDFAHVVSQLKRLCAGGKVRVWNVAQQVTELGATAVVFAQLML